MSLETWLPGIALLFINVVFGTIIVTLIKRESDRIEGALKKFATVQEVLQRLLIEFQHYRDEQKRIAEAVPVMGSAIERSERQIKSIVKRIDRMNVAITTLRNRITLLRAHSFPFIPDTVWGTISSVEEDLDNG